MKKNIIPAMTKAEIKRHHQLLVHAIKRSEADVQWWRGRLNTFDAEHTTKLEEIAKLKGIPVEQLRIKEGE